MSPYAQLSLCQNAIVKLIMSDEFEEWLKENWHMVKETYEAQEVLNLYIHDKNSPYYLDKPADYEDPFKVKVRHAPITPTPDYKWD